MMTANPFEMFAEVAPALPLSAATVTRLYTYRVPSAAQDAIGIGSHVRVPFGSRSITGTVVGLHSRRVPYPTKPLTLLPSSPLTPEQMRLAAWISATMHGSLGYTLRLFFPSAKRPTKNEPAPPRASSPAPQTPYRLLVIEKNDAERHRAIAHFLTPVNEGATQALVIVPEVSMVKPLLAALAAVHKQVLPYHSEQTTRQLANVWDLVYQQTSVIIVGTQKALFLPWRRLTHVVLEEEYLPTHKLWDQYPRLDNRYAVAELAGIHCSHLLYSSSLLSPARAYDMQQSRLEQTQSQPVVPKIQTVSLSFDDRRQGRLLPPEALHFLKEGLRKKERLLILHNQRGSWRAAVCTKCHRAVRCPECNSTVFVEGAAKTQRVRCRQCDYSAPLPDTCPNCHKAGIRAFGPGAAKIAHIIRSLLPAARLVEATVSTTLSAAQQKRTDIVIGTTALWRATANLTFDRALWLWPENTLLYPDFRSSEQAWALAARLQKIIPDRRRILVVTRYPGLVKETLAVSPDTFMTKLLRERQRLHYPPYTDLVKVTCLARTEKKALDGGRAIRATIDSRISGRLPDGQDPTDNPAAIIVRGPYQGFNKKEGGKFAVHLLLAGPLDQLVPLYQDIPIDRADLAPANIL